MPRIACIDAGMYYHHTSFHEPPLAHLIDDVVYIRDVARTDLARFDTLVVTCRCNAALLEPLAGQLQAFMRQGGTLVAMGETFQDRWLPGIDLTPTETNFWWWLEKGADLGVRIAAPDHPLFRYLDQDGCTWHLHGYFRTSPAQVSLLDGPEGHSILFEDRTTFAPGRLIATTLDPFFHHGSYFMPATTVFLKGFMQWLHDEPDPRMIAGSGGKDVQGAGTAR